MSHSGSAVQCGAAVRLLGVDPGAVLQQRRHPVRLAQGGRDVKGGPTGLDCRHQREGDQEAGAVHHPLLARLVVVPGLPLGQVPPHRPDLLGVHQPGHLVCHHRLPAAGHLYSHSRISSETAWPTCCSSCAGVATLCSPLVGTRSPSLPSPPSPASTSSLVVTSLPAWWWAGHSTNTTSKALMMCFTTACCQFNPSSVH